RRLIAALVVAGTAVAACGSDDTPSADDTAPPTGASTPETSPAGTGGSETTTPAGAGDVTYDLDGEAVFTVQGTPDTLDPYASANLVHIWNRGTPLYDRL